MEQSLISVSTDPIVISRMQKVYRMALLKAVCHANMDFDWDLIEASSQFKTRMQKRMKRHNLLAVEAGDWKSDPRERAWKIRGWWQTRLLQDDSSFFAFKTALRLVVLTQTSSCAVERVFSRLKMIRDTCGDRLYEDMLEVRMLMQCNGELGEFVQTL